MSRCVVSGIIEAIFCHRPPMSPASAGAQGEVVAVDITALICSVTAFVGPTRVPSPVGVTCSENEPNAVGVP